MTYQRGLGNGRKQEDMAPRLPCNPQGLWPVGGGGTCDLWSFLLSSEKGSLTLTPRAHLPSTRQWAWKAGPPSSFLSRGWNAEGNPLALTGWVGGAAWLGQLSKPELFFPTLRDKTRAGQCPLCPSLGPGHCRPHSPKCVLSSA